MQALVILLSLSTAVAARKTRFEFLPLLNDLRIHPSYNWTLGLPSTYGRPDECAQHCLKNPMCSVFTFNNKQGTCSLLAYTGNYLSMDHNTVIDGQRYHALVKDWCPSDGGFRVIPAVNLCVQMMPSVLTFDDAVMECASFGARLPVLADADKFTVMANFLANVGVSTIPVYMGTNDHNDILKWADGSQISGSMWLPGQPVNNVSQRDCVVFLAGGLQTIPCDSENSVMCEIAE